MAYVDIEIKCRVRVLVDSEKNTKEAGIWAAQYAKEQCWKLFRRITKPEREDFGAISFGQIECRPRHAFNPGMLK